MTMMMALVIRVYEAVNIQPVAPRQAQGERVRRIQSKRVEWPNGWPLKNLATKREIGAVKREIHLLRWMVGFNLAFSMAALWKMLA